MKETRQRSTYHDTGRYRLAYANEFREMLKGHRGIIRTAIGLMDKASSEYSPPNFRVGTTRLQWNKQTETWEDVRWINLPFPEMKPKGLAIGRGVIFLPGESLRDEKSGLEVALLGKSRRQKESLISYSVRRDKSDYFRLNLGDRSFFVKRSFITNNPGFTEFANMEKARDLLKDLLFVKVIEAQLGYLDKKQSWYVSSWQNLEEAGFMSIGAILMEDVDDYGRLRSDEFKDHWGYVKAESVLKKQIEQIRKRLKPADLDGDISVNLFYNSTSKTFILLDVSLTRAKAGKDPRSILGDPFGYPTEEF